MSRPRAILAFCLWFLFCCPVQASEIDFSHQIVPILKQHCVTCHGGREREGDFSINSRSIVLESGVVTSGDASESRLLDLITSDDPDIQMPPSDRPRLSQKEVELIRRWIDRELPWESGFSFEISSYEPPLRPRRVELPDAVDGRNHPIDRILDAYLKDRGLPLPGPVDEESFLRRVHLDLIGLLPTSEELGRFLRDRSPDKRERVIDELLARDLDYADHWLSFFNDLLRNDYSGTGFITGGRKQISQWLYAALVGNMPFDRMTRELVAPKSDASRGFIDGIKWRGTVSAGQTLPIQFAQSVTQSFLGINMKCASCHDSFIDRWTLKDAYGLAAVYAEGPLELFRCDQPTGETQAAMWLFPELGNVESPAPRDERLRQLADLMTHPENGRFSRTIVNRLWHRLMGRGIVHPLDAMQTEPFSEDLLDVLANHLVDHHYDLKSVLRLIASSAAYQSTCEVAPSGDESRYVYRGPRARRMAAEQFVDAVWQLTGAAPERQDAPVFRDAVSDDDSRRVTISGKWIWGGTEFDRSPGGETILLRKVLDLPETPTTGGLVVTCDNEFTLYVANKRVASGMDWTSPQSVNLKGKLKKGKNQIVLVAKNAGANGQPNPAGLFVQGRIFLAGGQSVVVHSDDTWQFHLSVPSEREGRLKAPAKGWQTIKSCDGLAVWNNVLETKARRLIAQIDSQIDPSGGKQPMIRAALMKNTPLMQSLGRPLREQIVSMRPSGLTTLEAIDLANDATLAAALKEGAMRWLEREFESQDELVTELFQATLTREPSDSERRLFREVLGENPSPQSIEDAMWAIMMLPEFLLIR